MYGGYEPPPESEAGDIDAERRASELEFDSFSGGIQMNVSEAYAPPKDTDVQSQVENIGNIENMENNQTNENDDLRVGGLATPALTKKQTTSNSSIESPLNGMSIKDLRRMAEANGIPGAAELRKKELIQALRNTVSTIINTTEPPAEIMSFDEIAAPDAI